MFSFLLENVKEDPFDFNKEGKIPALEEAFEDDPIALKVAYMIATSHEYDKPNVNGALAMVKNYKWKESTEKVENLEGINKPVNKEKVFEIATTLKEDGKNKYPLIVVDKIHAITPQSKGKSILFDGHHRKESLNFVGYADTPVYKGTYTGDSQKPVDELISETVMAKGFLDPNGDNIIQEASKKSKKVKIEKVPLTAKEREEVKDKYGEVECSFFKNAVNGKYFCSTHRASSPFYDSPTDIPVDIVKFISSTS